MGNGDWFDDHNQTIFTVIGIVSGVVAMVLSVKAGSDIRKELEENEPTETKEKVKVYVKHLWLPVTLETASIVCTGVSNHIRNVKLATAVTTAATATAALNETNKKVEEKFGAEEAQKIRKEVNQKVSKQDMSRETPENLAQNGRYPGDVLVFESLTQRYFWSTAGKIHQAEASMLRDYPDGKIPVDDWLDALGFDYYDRGGGPMSLASTMGWDPECSAEFRPQVEGTTTPQEAPCLIINYDNMPVQNKIDTRWGY